MPSAAGKRVGRVLAGCSKPEARDKPGLSYLARDTRCSRYHCIGQHNVRFETLPESENREFTSFSTISTISPGNHLFQAFRRKIYVSCKDLVTYSPGDPETVILGGI